jgi:hypothetical protein
MMMILKQIFRWIILEKITENVIARQEGDFPVIDPPKS